VGEGGKMTQTLYAHMNKRKRKKKCGIRKKKKKEVASGLAVQSEI
jgi:hypothetical protein